MESGAGAKNDEIINESIESLYIINGVMAYRKKKKNIKFSSPEEKFLFVYVCDEFSTIKWFSPVSSSVVCFHYLRSDAPTTTYTREFFFIHITCATWPLRWKWLEACSQARLEILRWDMIMPITAIHLFSLPQFFLGHIYKIIIYYL